MKKAKDLRIPFTWADRHPVLLERLLYVPTFYDTHSAWTPIPWNDPRIFGQNNPVFLEYCSGNGEWICNKAKQNPHINWVAVDKQFDRVRKIWARLFRDNLSNLYILCGEAMTLTQFYLPRHSLSEIFVNFPDPWPKLRHAKHRLIQRPFLEEVAGVMLPEGKATFVTDDPPYALQMLHELAQSPSWQPLLQSPHYILNPPDYGTSFFSDLWNKKGHNTHLLLYKTLRDC